MCWLIGVLLEAGSTYTAVIMTTVDSGKRHVGLHLMDKSSSSGEQLLSMVARVLFLSWQWTVRAASLMTVTDRQDTGHRCRIFSICGDTRRDVWVRAV